MTSARKLLSRKIPGTPLQWGPIHPYYSHTTPFFDSLEVWDAYVPRGWDTFYLSREVRTPEAKQPVRVLDKYSTTLNDANLPKAIE